MTEETVIETDVAHVQPGMDVIIPGMKHRQGISSASSKFSSPTGADECWLVLDVPDLPPGFSEACDSIGRRFTEAMATNGLSIGQLAFTRLYLSDIANQYIALCGSHLYHTLKSGAVSIIQQPPLSGAPLCLLAYFIRPSGGGYYEKAPEADGAPDTGGGHLYGNHYDLLWGTNYNEPLPFDAALQTQKLFGRYAAHLSYTGMCMPDNTVRTWIYVRDIDNHYGGMVEARREFFYSAGFSEKKGFPASTGIEGCGLHPSALVSMEMLSFSGLALGQIVRMQALDNMSPTTRYGVTFERGLRVRFGDRSHLYVSGTASIDAKGRVLYEGDIRRQTGRTLDNTEALLAGQHAGLDNLAHLIVYVRSEVYARHVLEIVRRRVPADVPVVALRGAVCRPAWLVEMEGIAITEDSAPYPVFL